MLRPSSVPNHVNQSNSNYLYDEYEISSSPQNTGTNATTPLSDNTENVTTPLSNNTETIIMCSTELLQDGENRTDNL